MPKRKTAFQGGNRRFNKIIQSSQRAREVNNIIEASSSSSLSKQNRSYTQISDSQHAS